MIFREAYSYFEMDCRRVSKGNKRWFVLPTQDLQRRSLLRIGIRRFPSKTGTVQVEH